MNTVGLWASAFVLGGLILTQAGKNQAAQADSITGPSGFSISTITIGNVVGTTNNHIYDVLWIIDDRSETLMIYYGDTSNRTLELKTIKNLSDLFSQARPK